MSEVDDLKALLEPGEEHPWRDYYGGGRPNSPLDYVQVRMRDGSVKYAISASIPWEHDDDIVQWRPAKKPPTAQQLEKFIPALLERVAKLEGALREIGAMPLYTSPLPDSWVRGAVSGYAKALEIARAALPPTEDSA